MVLMQVKWMMLLAFFLFQHPKTGPAAVAPHPFYISVTEINQNQKEQTLELSCKLFAEDLEQTLEKQYRTTLDISSPADKQKADRLIQDYIVRHLSLRLEGQPVKLEYVGFEKDKEAVYGYFQVAQVASVKTMEVVNTLLHDFSTDQINLLHVTVGGKRKSIKLDYPAGKAVFQFP